MLCNGKCVYLCVFEIEGQKVNCVCVCMLKVGQIHGGLMGIIQRSMVKACPHIWFERLEVKDRHLVAKR